MHANRMLRSAARAQELVLYDFLGAEEPRVIYPLGTQYEVFTAAAVRESDSGVPAIFTQSGMNLVNLSM